MPAQGLSPPGQEQWPRLVSPMLQIVLEALECCFSHSDDAALLHLPFEYRHALVLEIHVAEGERHQLTEPDPGIEEDQDNGAIAGGEGGGCS